MQNFRCCRRDMKSTEYVQGGNAQWRSREVTHHQCTHCGKIKLSKDHIDKTGEPFRRDIVVHELAVAEWIDIYPELTLKCREEYPDKSSINFGKTFVKELKDGTKRVQHAAYSMTTGKLREKWEPV